MKQLLITACVALLCACAKTTEAPSGSQTHFFDCTTTSDCAELGEGLACIDGLCREAEAVVDQVSDSGAVDDAVRGMSNLPGRICDGSDDMRLALSTRSIFFDSLESVYPHYGASFLFVDGQCRFYATRGYMHGLRTGTLSWEREAALVVDLGWTELASWTETPSVGDCATNTEIATIRRPGFASTCECGCASDAPAEQIAAMANVAAFIRSLAAEGAESDGPMRGAASPGGFTGKELPWPLARPMSEINRFVQPEGNFGSKVPAFFDVPEELRLLRQLRAQSLAIQAPPDWISVMENGVIHNVVLRDELPADAAAAAADLLELDEALR